MTEIQHENNSGYYCPVASVSATVFPCPSGKYGEVSGLTDDGCSGEINYDLDIKHVLTALCCIYA